MKSKQHDFKALLGDENQWKWDDGCLTKQEIKTCIYALRLADRLQSGNVSKDMMVAGFAADDEGKGLCVSYQEMNAQLMKEVEDDNS